MTTTNYTFPCDTVNGLTLTQKRAAIIALKESIKETLAYNRQEKEASKLYKAAVAEQKRQDRIAKLQAKIDAIKNPVGSKAIKLNKKPSKVTIIK